MVRFSVRFAGFRSTPLLFVIFWLPGALVGGETKLDAQAAEKIVRDGILAFRRDMRADDEQKRMEALDRVLPEETTFTALFGEKNGKMIWEIFKAHRAELLKNTDKFKAEMDSAGDIQAVRLYDVRIDDISGRYKKLVPLVQVDIPLYTATVKHQKGSSGSSTYVVVNGNLKWIQGLEAIPDLLAKQQGDVQEAEIPAEKGTSSTQTATDDEQKHPKALQGIWKVESVTVNGRVDKESETYLSLRADGTYKNIKKGKKAEGPWDIDAENKLLLHFRGQTIMRADRKMEGNTLTLSFEERPGTTVVIQYTRTDLKVEPKAVDEQ